MPKETNPDHCPMSHLINLTETFMTYTINIYTRQTVPIVSLQEKINK